MTDWMNPPRPYAIAHRGASAYAPGNTLKAFAIASDLGADFWEVDIRLTADGTLVAHHDAATASGRRLSELTFDALAQETAAAGRPTPRFDDVLALAKERGAGIYADIKDSEAAVEVARSLEAFGITRAILGAFDPVAVQSLAAANVPFPRAALVPLGADPFEHAAGADIIHLCWERMERPQDMLTPDFFDRAEAAGQKVVLWHEEDPRRMAALRTKPVLGICSDTPQLVSPFRAPATWPVETVAHRGANSIAPENTIAAAEAAFAAGFDVVELDLHSSSDGQLIVIHDYDLDRTTSGEGRVASRDFRQLRALDAGSWFDPHFADARLPTLREMLAVAQRFSGGIYVEIKEADPAQAFDEVATAGLADRCFFWSYRYDRLKALRALSTDARIMVARAHFPTLDEIIDGFRPDIVEYEPGDDLSDFDAVRAAGAKTMMHYAGQNPDVFDHIVAARPDIVNIDDIFTFRRRVEAAGLNTHGQ